MTDKTLMVTPKMAMKWLEKNASNRTLSATRVSAYARDMASGKWRVTPQQIVLNQTGDLLDGQHTLSAVIECGKPVRLRVSKGWDHEVRGYIDRGRPRSLADRLRMEGFDWNVPLLASVARNLVLLDRGGANIIVTDDEAMECMGRHSRGLNWLRSTTLAKGYRRAPYVATVIWSLPLGARVVEFHEGVQSGVNLKVKCPELAMRRVLDSASNRGGQLAVEIMLKAANCIKAATEDQQIDRVYASSIGYRALAKAMKKRLPAEGRLIDVVV